MDKRDFRREIRFRRSRLSSRERHNAAEKIKQQVITSHSFLVSKLIAIYAPVAGEIDTMPIARKAWHMSKEIYLPVLLSYRRRLAFARYQASTTMRPNRVGIDEPQGDPKHRHGSQQLDLILLPLVGFSDSGFRIGMGGGYYDASLEYLRYRTLWRRPLLIGMAYDFQRFDDKQIVLDSWDVKLDGVFTERRFYNCSEVN